MKKLLKVVGILILVLVVVVLIAGLILPKTYHLERNITINAPREKVWPYVGSLTGFNKWNPFSERDPGIQITYRGQEGTVGSAYSWVGNKDVGQGEQTLTKVDPQNGVETRLHFIKPFDGNANSFVKLADNAPTATNVTWGIDIPSSYPMNVMNIMMDGMMKKRFDKGLSNLKTLCERN